MLIGGSIELTQSNFPCWGDMVKRGTASTANENGDSFSTERSAENVEHIRIYVFSLPVVKIILTNLINFRASYVGVSK